jgi:hypothetical protein
VSYSRPIFTSSRDFDYRDGNLGLAGLELGLEPADGGSAPANEGFFGQLDSVIPAVGTAERQLAEDIDRRDRSFIEQIQSLFFWLTARECSDGGLVLVVDPTVGQYLLDLFDSVFSNLRATEIEFMELW